MHTEHQPIVQPERNPRRRLCLLVSLTLGLVLVGAVLLWPKAQALSVHVSQAQALPAAAAAPADSFLLRFDPALEAFEVFTIPTAGAAPDGVAVFEQSGTTEVWFAESGADQIGRLTYTDSADYTLQEFPLPSGSRPMNIAVDASGIAWFTENGRDRIGRVDGSTGITHEFAISTTEVAPIDLDIAPDGSIWFTERGAEHVGQLIVTTTTDYEVREFYVGHPSFPDIELSGIAVESNDRIWAILSNYDRIARLQPSVPRVDRTAPLETPGYPFMLALAPDGVRMWFTELHGNRVSLVFGSTMELGLRYTVPTSNSQPYDLAVDSTGAVWFSERLGGNVGRLVVTSTVTFTEFPVPLPRARIQGLALDSNDVVWCAAATWQTTHLPVVAKEYPPPPPVFGVITYWPLDKDNGLGEIEAMGAHWVRVAFSWNSVEPEDTTPEDFDWSAWDAEATSAASSNVSLVATVHGNPTWAAEYPSGPLYSDHVADFVELMQAAVERYDGDGYMDAPGSPVIQHWELYNEPDGASVLLAEQGYGYWGDYGAEYADLCRQVYPVMKAASPHIKLLNGGVAYERFREDDPDLPYVRRFLDDFFEAGGGNYIDIFNFHYYPNFAHLWEQYGRELIGKTAYFRSMLAQHGLDMPIVCTEIGQHSDPSRGGSDETQSRYVVKTFVWAMAADLEYANWFVLRDINSGFPYLYGLLDGSWERKPSFYAFSTLTEQLADTSFVRTMSVDELGHAEAEGYVFRAEDQDIYVVWTNDEVTRTASFDGSAVWVVDKYGEQAKISDGDDGDVDDVVTVDISPSPVYVHPAP
jgi:streptogramin lyase